jgi:formamidopyrimidine-DNA glycosylase
MPELPEVQTVVTTLGPRVTGRIVSGVTLNRDDILWPRGTDLIAALEGRTVQSVERRAKRVVFTLDDANRFYIHLGMSGQLTVESPRARVRNHTHLILHIGDIDVRFRDPRRFGGVFWLGRNGGEENLGPEPLRMTPARLAKRLVRTRRAIKTALLDQRLIAGIGNIYADEALFAAGINPCRRANELTPAEVGRLNRAIKLTLRRAIRHRGSTLRDFVDAENSPGGYRLRHRVYDREGEPCRRCKGVIERVVLGGRSTCFCPRCQPKVTR